MFLLIRIDKSDLEIQNYYGRNWLQMFGPEWIDPLGLQNLESSEFPFPFCLQKTGVNPWHFLGSRLGEGLDDTPAQGFPRCDVYPTETIFPCRWSPLHALCERSPFCCVISCDIFGWFATSVVHGQRLSRARCDCMLASSSSGRSWCLCFTGCDSTSSREDFSWLVPTCLTSPLHFAQVRLL